MGVDGNIELANWYLGYIEPSTWYYSNFMACHAVHLLGREQCRVEPANTGEASSDTMIE